VTVPNLNVAVLGAPDYARSLGKKSTTSDVTFYDLKQGEVTVSMVEPTMYPEKFASLFFATSLADLAVVVIDQISTALGETIVILDCLGVKRGYIVIRNFITEEQIAPLIKSSVLEKYSIFDDDPRRLREELMAAARASQTAGDGHANERGSVPVDHYFDVKGVGTVVLGTVAEGLIRKHGQVKVLPRGDDAEIRSIQKHDDDFETAAKGDRVGLALKGVSVDALDRGSVISDDSGLICRHEIGGNAHLVRYWQSPVTEGMVVHLGHWMQFEPGRIDAVDTGGDWRNPRLSISLQKDLVYSQEAKAILAHLDAGKLRVMGTLDLD
jgi:selenocysteine-specific translation elongation factor